MREAVQRLWPEIEWIHDPGLREQVTQTWMKALERSPLRPDDLNRIPFTLLVPNCPTTFMEHKRCVVHIARDSARAMQEFMGRALPIDTDMVIAGAILADVGKLLEYELGPDGKSRQSQRGEALRHPFTGVALALECGVPDAVCHIIAAHAAEGDLVVVPPHAVHAFAAAPGSDADLLIILTPGVERFEYFRQLQRIAAGEAPLESILETQDLYDNHFDDSPVWQQALAARL